MRRGYNRKESACGRVREIVRFIAFVACPSGGRCAPGRYETVRRSQRCTRHGDGAAQAYTNPSARRLIHDRRWSEGECCQW